jgi:hypothetical protein
MVMTDRLVIKYMMAILFGVCLFTGVANGEEHRFSDKYSMKVDPAAKQKMGEQTFNGVMAFFSAAETAIETKDLKALMDLYSESYRNGEHDKKSAEQIWERMFYTFETMATHHNMKLVSMSADKNTIILRCSGLLLGVPDHKKGLITIDNWTVQDHVIVKEAGKWKLIGTYGKDRKRLWFDKPIHPLF